MVDDARPAAGSVGDDDETVVADMAALLGAGRSTGVVAERYELTTRLGEGGVAVVHEAQDRRLDRRVAVKLLRDTATSAEDRARFADEARLLGRLSHPGLVRVLDAGIDGDRPYLVLELVRGRSLAEAMDDGLDADEVARIGAEVADALAHVHAAGIVHRDVKPGNVLLDQDGTAKLADFGIARLVDDTVHHTRTGFLVGTVAYLSPEQVAGEPVSTAVDVYSLGLVLLEALTGVRAYAGSSVESAFARLARQPEVPTTLPAAWTALLTQMTARDPLARPSAAEVAERIRAVRRGDVVPGLAHPVARPVAPPAVAAPRRRSALVAVAVAALLAVGGLTWSIWPTDAAPPRGRRRPTPRRVRDTRAQPGRGPDARGRRRRTRCRAAAHPDEGQDAAGGAPRWQGQAPPREEEAPQDAQDAQAPRTRQAQAGQARQGQGPPQAPPLSTPPANLAVLE
ncbi:serine/threonine protein kinase [Nocardioides anomalus]|uniref:non-specific serine/threonine protein kinase n=1 Tax=Nocardioides anomalus TaxID=2712223 RepID=A0A6G6WFS8_9ACTN|nr:serine/threonine-protein kinase [Nocardioides anomalus]QIG43900.1 serine/threonine protein kinase [Nocardioides anomalus]